MLCILQSTIENQLKLNPTLNIDPLFIYKNVQLRIVLLFITSPDN